jgi:hypothetical protein
MKIPILTSHLKLPSVTEINLEESPIKTAVPATTVIDQQQEFVNILSL